MKVLPDVGNNSHREKVLNAKKGTEKPESASVSKWGGFSKVMIPNTPSGKLKWFQRKKIVLLK